MSLVTTPIATDAASLPQSAAMRLLLPDPTGPPTPIRSARSADKESFPSLVVRRRRKLESDRSRCRLLGKRPVVLRDVM